MLATVWSLFIPVKLGSLLASSEVSHKRNQIVFPSMEFKACTHQHSVDNETFAHIYLVEPTSALNAKVCTGNSKNNCFFTMYEWESIRIMTIPYFRQWERPLHCTLSSRFLNLKEIRIIPKVFQRVSVM